MIRVLVADDHAMLREMLKIALSRLGEFEVVGEAQDGREVSRAVGRCRPDVVLLDYKMPLIDDYGALVRKIRQADVRVIVLSGYGNLEVAHEASRAGATGYVLKSTRLQCLGDAVRSVAAGGVWIDPNLPKRAFQVFQQNTQTQGEEPSGLAELTRRERQVLACVADGLGNRAISLQLSISEPTVKTHLTRVFAKLDVKNRTHAARLFFGREVAAQAAVGRS